MAERVYEVVLVLETDGGFSAFVPELPSVASQGESADEALEKVRDAIDGYLETMRDEGWTLPAVRRERVVVRISEPSGRSS